MCEDLTEGRGCLGTFRDGAIALMEVGEKAGSD